MTKLFHGTAMALGAIIEQKGLNPVGPEFVSPDMRKSTMSEKGYIYLTDDKNLAKIFACGTAKKVGLGNKGQIFEVDAKDLKIEKDPQLPNSFMIRGTIPPEKLKSLLTFSCNL